MKKLILLCFLPILLLSCNSVKIYDLAITNAKVLNSKTGIIAENKTILVKNDKIVEILNSTFKFKAKNIINAKGKLVTAGLIDTHIHPTDVFGDYENAPLELARDSIHILRKNLSDEYLPYGTTTVLTMGQPEKWLKPLIEWQKNSTSNYVDFYVCGGALISKDNRVPYIGHTEVISEQKAREKIVAYNQLGIKHLKLYFRLKEPEFSTALKVGDSLKMKIYGHIGDFNPEYLTMKQTLDFGLYNYEHVATIPNSLITSEEDWNLLNKQFAENFGELNTEARIMEFFLEQFRYLDTNKQLEMEIFINDLAKQKCTFSTTIHRIYEQIQPTYYTKNFFANQRLKELSPIQLKRCQENFSIMMKYVKQMNDKGILIRLGSDMINGGKVNISELIILSKHGFNTSEIFKIATFNGAKSMGIENEVGNIEKNMKANLIIWNKNPFENNENFLSEKTIIKNGQIIKN